jgi:hypothetical protein
MLIAINTQAYPYRNPQNNNFSNKFFQFILIHKHIDILKGEKSIAIQSPASLINLSYPPMYFMVLEQPWRGCYKVVLRDEELS